MKMGDPLVPTDGRDVQFGKIGSRLKTYAVKLVAGKAYTLVLESSSFDPYLRLHGLMGQPVAADDNSAGGLNARITYIPPVSGTYTVAVTATNARTGNYTLTISGEAGQGGTLRLDPARYNGGTEPNAPAVKGE
jgi:hypothetical protein